MKYRVSKGGTQATQATRASAGVAVNGGQGGKPPKSLSAKDIGARRANWPVDDLRSLVSPVRPTYPGQEVFPADSPWIRIDSQVLGEEIVLVLHPGRVRDAEEASPGSVVYVVPEMEILGDFAERPEVIRRLHAIKKDMRGWLVRPQG